MVTIKDIKDYLSTMPDDTPVLLDKDGWTEDDNQGPFLDVQRIIHQRGLFHKSDQSKFGGGLVLIINN